MSSRFPLSRAQIVLLSGVFLLTAPAALSGVTLGAQTHYYNAGYVEVTDDGYDFEEVTHGSIDRNVLCWGSVSRACQIERQLLDGNVSGEMTTAYYDRHPDYTHLYHDGTFYETEASDGVLWLREVNTSTALEVTARPGDSLPNGVVAALENGQGEVATHADLPIRQLVEIGDDRYATLTRSGADRTPLDEVLHTVEPLLGPLSFVLGLGLVIWSQRLRFQRRHRSGSANGPSDLPE